MTNLGTLLTDSATQHAERIAIKLDDVALPYAVVEEASARVAGMLAAKGIGPGDRVGIMLPNLPYFAFAFHGVLRLGAEVVPMNPLLKEREVAFHLGDSGRQAAARLAPVRRGGASRARRRPGAECLLVERGPFEETMGAAEPVREVLDRDDADTAVLLYTSGTTGTPKGAELTHGNLRAATDISVELVAPGPGDGHVRRPAAVPRLRAHVGAEHRRSPSAAASRCCRASTRARRSRSSSATA